MIKMLPLIALLIIIATPFTSARTIIHETLITNGASNTTNIYNNYTTYNVTGITNGSDAYLGRLNVTVSLFANASRTINDAYANRFRLTSGYFVVSDTGWYWDNGVGGFLATGAGLALDHISSYGYDSRLTIEQDTGINELSPVATLHVTASDIAEPSIIAKGTVAQVANIFEVQDSTGKKLLNVHNNGLFNITGNGTFSGKLGVGTFPTAMLDIVDTDHSNTGIHVRDSSWSGGIYMSQDAGGNAYIYTSFAPLYLSTQNGGYPIYFRTASTVRGIIDSNGLWGINTSTPTQTLDVRGNINTSGILYYGAAGSQMRITSGSDIVYLQTAAGGNTRLYQPGGAFLGDMAAGYYTSGIIDMQPSTIYAWANNSISINQDVVLGRLGTRTMALWDSTAKTSYAHFVAKNINATGNITVGVWFTSSNATELRQHLPNGTVWQRTFSNGTICTGIGC